ncbi:MAG: DNA-processing protein DprA [Spirochaetes bacterium]|jgi:DNA protecting protein DprA|nr:DNA-processing protein DprA [Spirochaetota bacterium]
MMIEGDGYYLLLLSLLSAPVYRETLLNLETSTPRDIFSRLREEYLTSVAHVKKIYGSDVHEAADRVIERCANHGIEIIPFSSSAYPQLLRSIPDPPLVLYRQGNFTPGPAVAIVGSRSIDAEAKIVTDRLCCGIAAKRHVIVSGIARGVDRQAHVSALRNGAATIAVTACGLDRIYPCENRDLFESIRSSSGSALISEHPPGVGVMKWTFVRRNRIISGLCRATVVVKAGIRSGALITARCAVEQNRDLFVTPSYPYNSAYTGSFRLINQGAVALLSHEQLFSDSYTNDEEEIDSENSGILFPDQVTSGSHRKSDNSMSEKNGHCLPDISQLSVDQLRLYSLIRDGIRESDDLIRSSEFSPSKVTELLLLLELGDYVKRTGNRLSIPV